MGYLYMAEIGLLGIIDKKVSDYDITNRDWYRFVFDHCDNIIANSKLIIINDIDAVQYEYKFSKYLTQRFKIQLGLQWIVSFVNDISDDMDFSKLTALYIPSSTYLEKLYQSYQTTEFQEKK